MLANAGYDAIDYNLANIVGKKAFHTSEEYRKYTARLLEKSKENGVYFNQGHAVTYVPSDNPEDKAKLLSNLIGEIYISDIVKRNKIRNIGELEDLLNILSSSIGSLTNPEKLKNTFQTVKKSKITAATIKKYIDCFE